MNEECEACLSRRRVYGDNGCSMGGTHCVKEVEA